LTADRSSFAKEFFMPHRWLVFVLVEDETRALSAQNDSFQFDVRGFEIKTFKLKIKPLPKP
jgi:hypothetical protein